jgi:hypothetical protein
MHTSEQLKFKWEKFIGNSNPTGKGKKVLCFKTYFDFSLLE